MTMNVNSPRTAAPTATTTSTTDGGAGTDYSQMKSAKELMSGGSFKSGIDASTGKDDLTKAFSRFTDSTTAAQYAETVNGIGKEFRGSFAGKLEKRMNDYLQKNPNATPKDIAAEGRKALQTESMMAMTIKQTVMQITNDTMNRMKDLFEG
ncbi:hypothetical protein [Archangium primigenium]|uniref:hypothetical protein n=1 Tax=[Archangium] primigenium TaxID=2792470 RepID=UPI001959EF6A|nr:hypothetical protein [Archangium primigenium]MBM7118172.1 hypothetical protein [Archangium primigenium]